MLGVWRALFPDDAAAQDPFGCGFQLLIANAFCKEVEHGLGRPLVVLIEAMLCVWQRHNSVRIPQRVEHVMKWRKSLGMILIAVDGQQREVVCPQYFCVRLHGQEQWTVFSRASTRKCSTPTARAQNRFACVIDKRTAPAPSMEKLATTRPEECGVVG